MTYFNRIYVRLLSFIEDHEGMSSRVYKDLGNYPTIGIGHKLTSSEFYSGKLAIYKDGDLRIIDYRKGLSRYEMEDIFRHDVDRYYTEVITCFCKAFKEEYLDKAGEIENKVVALTSLCFNIGCEAFANSTMAKILKLWEPGNDVDTIEVPAQFRRWVYSRGRKVEGLKNRREREIDLWLSHSIEP